MKISIVIPAYNEEATIEATLDALAATFDAAAVDYELRVVDDGSRDSTWDLLGEIQARLPNVVRIKNAGPGGYGMAVRAGLDTFDGDGVIVAMADGSDNPRDVLAYAKALIEGYGCAFGTRFGGQTKVEGYPPIKRILNRCGNWLIAKLTGVPYDDFTNGFKGYTRCVIDQMQPLVSADFNLTVEMSMKAVMTGAKFKVIPNDWRDRDGGVSKFKLLSLGPRYLMSIAYCWLGKKLKTAGARPR